MKSARRVLSERAAGLMLRARPVQRPPSRPLARGTAHAAAPLRSRSAAVARPSSVGAAVPVRFYAKSRGAQAASEAPADASAEPSGKDELEEDDKEKKQQVVPGPVPLSFWYTSDKTYIDENYMRARDIYRVATFDLQEAVRLRAKEFELHLDEFKRRLRAPQLTEYLKHQQQAVAEYRPILKAAIKERRQARKDYALSIDLKVDKELSVSNEQLQTMANTHGTANVKEMNDALNSVLVKAIEGRLTYLSELAHDPVAEELFDQPTDIFERELFLDELPTTPKEGANFLDNMLMSDWFPDPKHLDNGADTPLKEWHQRKDFVRSHAKLNGYGLRTHPLVEGPPPKDWHQKQVALLNRRAREVAEKLAMPQYLRLPLIPKDASPERREHLVKMQLLIHEARRLRLAVYRRDLDKVDTQERIQELKAATDDPTGFEAFVAATPKEDNYQLAALLIQLEQAQQLVAKGEVKREDLIGFPEAVGILRRIVQDRNIPFALIPPHIDPATIATSSGSVNDIKAVFMDAAEGAAPAAAATEGSPAAAADAAAAAPVAAPAADAVAAPVTDPAQTTAAAPAPAATTVAAQPAVPPTEPAPPPATPTPPPKVVKPREPLPPLPRVNLQQKLSPEEVAALEKELRDLEVTDLKVLPNASEYIDELRNMISAYSQEEVDYSFLDKDYDVEISHRYSLFPDLPNPYGQKMKQMHERRVRMLVRVESLGLPTIVKKRLLEIAGPRYDAATDKLIVTSDTKTSSFQNIRYAKKLLQRLIAEAYLAHPRYISMDDLTPPKPVTLGQKIELPKQLPLKFGIFRFRRPLYLDSDWEQLNASAPTQVQTQAQA